MILWFLDSLKWFGAHSTGYFKTNNFTFFEVKWQYLNVSSLFRFCEIKLINEIFFVLIFIFCLEQSTNHLLLQSFCGHVDVKHLKLTFSPLGFLQSILLKCLNIILEQQGHFKNLNFPIHFLQILISFFSIVLIAIYLIFWKPYPI